MSGPAPTKVGEFDFEPLPGLPEALPEGESILWQGRPRVRSLARRAFHTHKIALYFALLLSWRALSGVSAGEPPLDAALAVARLTALAALALGILWALAWANSRATVYTITDRRVVMRFGVAFVMALNLPFRRIHAAELRRHGDGSGDLPLVVEGIGQLGYALLWPHARPWRFGREAQPMLRCIPEAERVADLLAEALAASATRSLRRIEPGPLELVEPRSVAVGAS